MSEKKIINVEYPIFNPNENNPYQEEMDKLLDISLTEASTTRSIKNIIECLTKSLKSKYKITDKEELKEKVNAILKLHGLSSDNFDPLSTISKLTFGTNKNINDFSIDDNANKTSLNMEGICGEAFLPYKKVVGYDYLYQTIMELYGKNEAKKCCASMYDLSIALNDSTKITIPYCFCIDASKLVLVGRNFGQVHSSPAHRISTYVSILCDTIREISFSIAGACAIGSYFLDVTHLAIYKERITLDDVKTDKKIRKYITNCFQQFIHSVNHYSRNSVESPFTNVSLFDRDKLTNLISDDNYGWYFPKKASVIEDNGLENTKEAYKNFVLDYIEAMQELYIDVFDAGDPLRNGLQYPFPVTTCLPANEHIVLNDRLSTFGEEFSDYEYGWTDVSDDDLYTQHLGKRIKINKVFKSQTDKLIKFKSSTMDEVTVTPEHKFKTIDNEYVLAKDIKIGDRLLTYVEPIIYENNKTNIKVSDYIDNLWVLGYKISYSEESAKYINELNLCRGFDNNKSMHCNTNEAHPLKLIESCNNSWFYKKPDIDLVRTKESRNKAAIPNNIELTEEFGRFLGLYYAEGHNSNGELGLSFNINEKEYVEFVQNFLNKFNIKSNVRLFEEQNACQVVFYSRTLGLLLDILVGKYCYGKVLHNDLLFNTPLEFRKGILRGCIEGDGYVNEYVCNISTTSYKGAKSIMYLSNSLGIRSKIKTLEPRKHKDGAKIISKHIMYEIVFNKYDIQTHNYDLGKTDKFYKTDKPLNTVGYYITSIEYIDTEEDIFNIEVDSEEHLYTLPNGLITSNCNFSIKFNESGERELTEKNNRLLDYITGKDISKYNIYCSEGTKVASCCLASTTKVLARIDGYVKYLTVAQLYNIWNVSQNKKIIEIMGDNGFVKIIKGWKINNDNNVLNKITLENGLVISTTLDHPSVKFDGDNLIEVKSEELKVGDIIPVSKNIQYNCLNGGSFELGRYVGLFGAEGMFDRRRDNTIYFCFNTNEKEYQQFIKDFSLKNFGADSKLEISSTFENSSRVRVMSRAAYGLIRDFFVGDLCTEKRLTSKIFNMSEEFRKGFLTGFIEGDGYTANSDRGDYGSIHINNKELARDIVAVANSVNIKCSLRIRLTSQTINILHNDKMKLDVLKDWHNGSGSKQKSTILIDCGDYYGIKIESIEQIKTKKNCSVYDFTVDSENHLFQIANGIITHNCRLLNDTEMMSLGEGVNSFGGSQISLGSHRVATVDMFRVACEATSYDNFKKLLSERVEECAKILQAHRVLIHKLEKCGTQPWITNGWINMSHMFSTFGCVGYVEADKLLKHKFNHKEFDYMKDFLVYFNNECKAVSEKYKMIWNLEAIPAEGMAPKLAKADNILFGNSEGLYNDSDFVMPDILANQWCSLWEDFSIYDKMKRDGEIQRLMTGGSIVHINVDSKITKTQAKKLIEDSIKFGMAHFALNAIYVECQDCGNVVKQYLDECPNCHSHHLNHYSRVIGYFSKIESWSEARRTKDFPKRKFLNIDNIKSELGE